MNAIFLWCPMTSNLQSLKDIKCFFYFFHPWVILLPCNITKLQFQQWLNTVMGHCFIQTYITQKLVSVHGMKQKKNWSSRFLGLAFTTDIMATQKLKNVKQMIFWESNLSRNRYSMDAILFTSQILLQWEIYLGKVIQGLNRVSLILAPNTKGQ